MIRALSTVLIVAPALAGCSAVPPSPAFSGPCVPPPDILVDEPHPEAASFDELVSHTEEVVINQPLVVVLAAEARNLEDVIDRSQSSLPGVAGTHNLNDVQSGQPGARRIVCLTDGSTLMEEALELEERDDYFRFRYVVWNYTSERARPILYGVGQFVRTPIGPRRTHVEWTYGFKLRRDRFPGFLGPLGNWLFRVTFLEGPYASMMRRTLAGDEDGGPVETSSAE